MLQRWAIVVLLLTSACHAQMKTERLTVQPETLVTIGAREPCVWWIQTPGVDVRSLAQLDGDGNVSQYVGVFWSGAGGRTLTVDEVRNGAKFPVVIRHVITVGDGPGPDPGPTPPPVPPEPDLSAFAASVRNLALEVKQPDTAKKIGDAYASVAAKIGAGATRTVQAARDAVEAEMKAIGPLDKAWKPVGDMLAKEFTRQVTTIDKAAQLCNETALGMWSAGKGT